MALITGSFWSDFLVVLVGFFTLLYAYFRYSYRHFRKRGIPTPLEPSFPFGNFPGIGIKRAADMLLADVYHKTSGEQLIGAFFMANPVIVVRDLDIIQAILVKDFSNFQNRGIEFNFERDPLASNLFMLSGHDWRNLRVTLTPTFTSGKMKMMFPTIIDVGKQLQNILDEEVSQPEFDVKDVMARYTIDVISSVAFGIESNSLKNPKVEFRTITQEFSNPSLKQIFVQLVIMTSPKLTKLFRVKFVPDRISKFFVGMVKDTMDFRETNGVKRNDFLQLLLQLKNLGHVKDVDNHDVNESDLQKFTVEQAAAQAFLFFFAGFETSSSTIQYALYELAMDPELQRQTQAEIDREVAKHNGELTYDAVGEMELLDRVVSETLRKYPVAGVLMRECAKEYPVPGTNYVLKPKDSVQIAIYGIHHDPEIYPDPEKFDPDRFLPEARKSRHPMAYLPFGEGPRSCIGNRFALLQTKVGVALLLAKYSVAPSKRTPIPLVFDPKVGVMKAKDPIYLKVARRPVE